MPFVYVQATGALVGPDGRLMAHGYSGHSVGLNNPAMQVRRAIGPIPIGRYSISPAVDPPDHLGPLALPLTPDAANVMFDRSGFFVHGDNQRMDHTASDGCIVLPHVVRRDVADSDDDALIVVATEAEAHAFFNQGAKT